MIVRLPSVHRREDAIMAFILGCFVLALVGIAVLVLSPLLPFWADAIIVVATVLVASFLIRLYVSLLGPS